MKPTMILTADWHLRETSPIARTDDFWETQWEKVRWISELQKEHDCIVVHSGDLFDHWKPSPYLLNTTIKNIPDKFYTVYGNHDLPQHNLQESHKCGIDVLVSSGKVQILEGTHFGQKPKAASLVVGKRKILVWHVLTYKKELPFPGCEELSAIKILKKYPQYDLILTGDNHKTFISTLNDRVLINPGSLTRQKADQIDHTPCVFLYYAENNAFKKVSIPIKKDVISREHIEKTEERNNRIDAFITSLNMDFDTTISFKYNLKKFYAKNKIKKSVKELITKFTEV